MGNSRLDKSMKNARINLVFYALTIFIAFFSRKIFLKSLGDEFIGLTSTLQNILGVINIVELGVGGAVGYMLYKPLFDGNQKQINEIISIFGYIYRKIGIIVAIIALLLVPFLPLFFKDENATLPIIYFAYFSFTLSSLLGYFVNYKQLLLNADQRNYEVTIYYQSANILRLAIQTAVAYYLKNLYLWIALEVIFSIIYSIIISKRVRVIYPNLNANIKMGKALIKSYPEIITKTKQIFVHKIAAVSLINLSPVILFSFTSNVLIAYYTNYTLILSKMSQLIMHLMSSIDAAVGSVVAEGNRDMIRRIYFEMTAVYYFVAGVITISLFFLVNPFITVLFGIEYILPQTTIIIILANYYLGITRAGNDIFLAAYGMFHDMWAPIAEATICIAASIIGGEYFGMNGVLMGSILSVVTIVHIWKPYFLFRSGMKERLSIYWFTIFKHLSLTFITFALVYYGSKQITIAADKGYWEWTLYAVIIFCAASLILYLSMYILSRGMRDVTRRMLNNLLKRR